MRCGTFDDHPLKPLNILEKIVPREVLCSLVGEIEGFPVYLYGEFVAKGFEESVRISEVSWHGQAVRWLD